MENVAFHKSETAKDLIRAKGAWVLFLRTYSPDLNPMEMTYSKLKTLLRKQAARNFEAAGLICELFSPVECRITSKQPDMESIKCDTLWSLARFAS